MAVDISSISSLGVSPGELPRSMAAWVLRPEREGDLSSAYEVEEIEVPEPGPFEVVVRVMAAGVNFNSIWAALAQPISVFAYGDHPQWGHHIGGSDCSGVVWKVGAGVTRWKPGDEVVIHANHASYEDPEVHGLDPLAAPSQLGWGYQTTWGSFAQFCKVQAQQLLPKPPGLSWVDASAYAVTYFTAYRMLVDKCEMQAGQNVLVWGAAGGLGVFAVQLCQAAGANAVGVVSSAEKGKLVEQLGAVGYIDRTEFAGMVRRGDESADEERERLRETRRFAKRVSEILGDAPDIVFEHVGRETFPASVFTAKPFGKVVTCGATTGYSLDFDVRYLWMRQKQILGCHAFNAYEAWRANELIRDGRIRPVLWKALDFEDLPEAHRLVDENRHLGKIAIMVGAEDEEEGKTAPGPGAIRIAADR
ncbi:MAG TPA: crotonyl-CoA carboxylase/reductase [Solirubrobacterales bacterium]|nr:crotonyl-CoA carboxylase/reductase [Solirubrobacterales bacterium]